MFQVMKIYTDTCSNVCVIKQVDADGQIMMTAATDLLVNVFGFNDQNTLDKISATCGNSSKGKISLIL
jgi:hypothetical protein